MQIFFRIISGVILILISGSLQAQDIDTKKDDQKSKTIEGHRMWNLDVLAGVDKPAADLAKRFGTSYRIGFGIKYKTATHWIFGAKFEFITGNQLKEDSLLYNLQTSLGGIISNTGEVLNVGMFQRGYMTGIQVGRVFPLKAKNPDSGPMTIASLGFMQYKINFYDRNNAFPQLNDEYEKGYDRLTNGIYISDFIGYNYHSKSKLINAYFGFDFVWGITKVRRDYIIDLARAEPNTRTDIMIGLKLGWVVPIYRKKSEETYY